LSAWEKKVKDKKTKKSYNGVGNAKKQRPKFNYFTEKLNQ